jgi:biotin operon repressor
MDPAMRRRVERRILATMRRMHRSDPLRAGIRIDTLIERFHADERTVRPASHRGASPLSVEDAALLEVVDALMARGELLRVGRRVRLPGHVGGLGAEMQPRVDRMLGQLRSAGPMPPRADALAAQLGIARAILDQLRQAGVLVAVAPGIDYPADLYDELLLRIRRLADTGPLSVARVRDELGTSRRHAAALLARLRSSGGRAEPQ